MTGRVSVAVLALLVPVGCARVQPAPAQPVPVAAAPAPPLSDADRLRLFDQLTTVAGAQHPAVSETDVKVTGADGAVRSVPVIRVVVSDSVFFDTGQDLPLPGSAPTLDLIAANLRRDGAAVRATVVGHTDGVGGDAYNLDLSRRRAAQVVAGLVARHVPGEQLSAVPMGKGQPVASDETAEGRARNRRVEFLVSTDVRANQAAILANRAFPVAGPAARARAGKPAPKPMSDAVLPQSPAPADPVVPRTPDAVDAAPLGPPKRY